MTSYLLLPSGLVLICIHQVISLLGLAPDLKKESANLIFAKACFDNFTKLLTAMPISVD